MPNQPKADPGTALLSALAIADDTARRAIGRVLNRFYDYDHALDAYIPRGAVSYEEMRRTIEEAMR